MKRKTKVQQFRSDGSMRCHSSRQLEFKSDHSILQPRLFSRKSDSADGDALAELEKGA